MELSRKVEFLPEKRKFSTNTKDNFKLEILNNNNNNEQDIKIDNKGKNKSDEFSFDPSEVFSFRFSMRRIGAGLVNLGNTCYLNSVLQCLTYTEPLAAYLQSGRHKSSCRKAGFCALCAIQNHVSRALQCTGRSLAPKDLVLNLRCISRSFRNARQEDAHEYMVSLLESMHECCLPSGVPSESPSAFEKSLVHNIFGGQLRSQVKCMQCSFCSDKFDPFLDLSLEINNANTLHKALSDFMAKEYLDGGARVYQCERCNQKVKALKQLSVHKAPYVLNIHLKRFGCHLPGQKIGKKVHFGTTLDLKPFVTGAYEGDLKYTLYGVLVHYGGNTRSGHYSCFVRTSSGTWYSLDDDRVCNVGEKRVLEERAYMLFYVRDRKSFIQKKSVDVVHAKSMMINAMENRMQSDSNQNFKKSFQNGSTDKRVESLYPLHASAHIDVAVSGASNETNTKGNFIQETVVKTEVKSSLLEKDVQLTMPIVEDDVKGRSHLGDCSTQSAVVNGSDGGLNNVVFLATNIEINECNKERSTNDNSSDLVVELPNSKCLQNSANKNEEKVEEDKCNGLSVDPHIDVGVPPKDCDEKKHKILNPSDQIEEPSHVNLEIVGISEKINNDDSAEEMEIKQCILSGIESTTTILLPPQSLADNCAKEMEIEPCKLLDLESRTTLLPQSLGCNIGKEVEIEPRKLSGPESATTILLPPESLGRDRAKEMETGLCRLSGLQSVTAIHLPLQSFGHNSGRKLKKKLPKSQVPRTRLSSGIIWGAAFSLRKKKHKRVKRSTFKIGILSQEHMGPSTSEETRPLPIKVKSQRKRSKMHSNKSNNISSAKNSNGDSNLVERVGDNKSRGRVCQNDAAVVTNNPPPCIINGSVGREGSILQENRSDFIQNGFMNMLTRGLEETTIARWDVVKHSSFSISERTGSEPVSIGYVGDEWDQEYDKGKRKKVRTSATNFGGLNPFQVLATSKAKLRKTKLDRSSSANQPFRI